MTKHRRRARGRDADDDRRAVDDSTELEIAIVGPVDDVAGRAGSAGCGMEGGRGHCIMAFGNGECSAGQVVRLPFASPKHNALLLSSKSDQRFVRLRREDRNFGTGRRQQFRLPDSGGTVAGDDHRPAGEIEEDRQDGERRHARRRRRLRLGDGDPHQ